MFNHVLVPLDGSALSESAIETARQAVGPDSRITLLSAVDMPDIPIYGVEIIGVTPAPRGQNALRHTLERARNYLDSLAQSLRADGFDARFVVQVGEPASVIAQMARKLDVDAIVMSTHGRSGVSRWIFGSVTNKVLAMASCPIIVVPSPRHESSSEANTALVGNLG